MSKGSSVFINLLLDLLDLDVPLVPFESPYAFLKRKSNNNLKRERYQQAVWKLKRAGVLAVVKKKNEKFLMLTKDGQLRILLNKAGIVKLKKWDGKWRVVVFDIPEDSRERRDEFRALLKKNNFVMLQASVFISPYPLNREAISYLRKTGLMDFIRILLVQEMDDDEDLRKKFNLEIKEKYHSLFSRP